MIEDPLSEDLKTAITAWAACSYAKAESAIDVSSCHP
jgi:hypothetical protein